MSDTYRTYWERAIPWERYLEREVTEHRDLWQGVYRTARIPEWAVREAERLEHHWRLLVLAEDWCGDASNTVPVLARLAEVAPGVELRILKRDENPELMDRYLTNGSRSIPIAIALDETYEPAGRWGPRPRELQDFVLREKRGGKRAAPEIYRDARRWYARDHGETTLRELFEVLRAAEARLVTS
ncbi:MAG: thioredoxin family protein [Gemmatimonadota bacterium]